MSDEQVERIIEIRVRGTERKVETFHDALAAMFMNEMWEGFGLRIPSIVSRVVEEDD